jgi:hemolysin III
VCYTIGAIALATKKPNPWPKVFGFHEIFHAFTVIAAGLQFAAIAGIVAPRLAA